MIFLVWLTGVAYGISLVGSGVVGIVGVAIVIYSVWAYVHARSRTKRGKGLALAGVVATLFWSIGLITLFCYVEAHLN